MSGPLLALDAELRVLAANASFYRTFQVSPANVERRFVYELMGGKWDIPDLRALLTRVVRDGYQIENYEVAAEYPIIGWRNLLLKARRAKPPGMQTHLLLALQDITELRRTRTAQQDGEVMYRTIFELARDILMLVDREGNILDINPSAEVLTGYSLDELRQMNVFDHLIVPEDQPTIRQVLQDVVAGADREYEVRWKTKDGHLIPFIGRSTARRSPGGEFLSTVCDLHAITLRKQAEDALKRSEERFRALIENSLDAILLYSADGTTLYASPSISKINGYSPQELVGKNRFDWVHADDLERVRNEWDSLLQEPGKIITSQARGRHKDGSWLWIERVFHNLLDDPNLGAIVTNLRDITEWKRTDEALRDSEAKFRGIFETVHNVIVMVDRDGTILDINSHVENTLGYTPSELRQRNVFEGLYVPEDRPHMKQVIADLVEGHDREYEVRWIAKDGHIVTFAGASTSRFGAHGEFISTLCTYMDITDRKRAEQALGHYTGRLETLHAIDQAILAARSLDKIAQAVLKRVMGIVACQEAHISLFDFDARETIIYAARSAGERMLESGMRHSFDEMGVIREEFFDTLRKGQVAKYPDIATLPRVTATQNLLLQGLRSAIIAPLRVRGELIGTLSVWADQPDRFVEENEDVMREVADSLAIAVAQVHLFEEASAARDRLQALSRRLVETQEIERQRLASELHDQVGQQLTSMGINLSVLRRELPAHGAIKVKQRLTDSQRLLDETFQRIRNVTSDLRPAVLEDFGLDAALRWYAEQYSQRTGLEVNVQSAELTTRFGPDIEFSLFRIAQEGLTNVIKHAQATEVRLALAIQKRSIELSIIDNGIGFDLTELHQQVRSQGLGLLIMQERAEAVGGRLQVKSKPGKGTHIRVEIPR